MATGTGNLPYPGKSYTPFDILTAEELNEDVANIESLATGAGIGDNALPIGALSQAAKDVLGSYSLSEVATPFKWVDGKTIYKKTINFGALPNSTTKTVAHGVSGMDYVIKYEAVPKASTTGTMNTLPRTNTNVLSAQSALDWDNVNINITTAANLSVYNICYITFYYTKV